MDYDKREIQTIVDESIARLIRSAVVIIAIGYAFSLIPAIAYVVAAAAAVTVFVAMGAFRVIDLAASKIVESDPIWIKPQVLVPLTFLLVLVAYKLI